MSSIWIETTENKIDLKPLEKDEETEICVIGAGLFGLTTAYYFAKQGKKVIVVEKEGVGEKVSGNTTGKITSQHGLIYNHLIKDFGNEYAKKYLEANEQAIKNIKNIIETEKIECDFSTQNAYVYTTQKEEVIDIQKEVEAVNSLGKQANFLTQIDLPLKIEGAIEFQGQAQFHVRKYIIGLCKNILKKNKIYNYTTVTDLEKQEKKYKIITDKGNIFAKYVVIATHYPIINIPGFYFTKMYQSTSYLIAVETSKKLPQGMYINVKDPIFSFRTAKYKDKEILLIGGSDHKTGKSINNNSNYEILEKKAKELYPDYKILFRWNTRDCISLDKIPYIGQFSSIMPNVYVGTGFKKWGMTFSNIAANIVSDKIAGKVNIYEDIFNSLRIEPIKNRWEVQNMIKETINSEFFNKLKIKSEDLGKIKNDNGAILKIDGVNVGIYKNKQGNVFAVKPNCSHLGCLLSWNNIDKTWDCPCHGSRFDYMGNNIYEPAIKGLEVLKF